MQGLRFFQRTSDRKSWNVASWHSPHSLTWRWILGFSLDRGGNTKRLWPIFCPYRTNHGLNWMLRIPFIGTLRWSVQHPMWYRDLHQRARDEHDGLSRRQNRPPGSPPMRQPTHTGSVALN